MSNKLEDIKTQGRAVKPKTAENETLQTTLDKAKKFFAALAPQDVLLSEQLIRERREEAKHE